jgi:hypothetical protein
MSLVVGVWQGQWWIKDISATEEHLSATFAPCSCGDRREKVRHGSQRSFEEAKQLLIEKVYFICVFLPRASSI